MRYVAGFDYLMLKKYGAKIPITISPESHMIIVGSSGSGKSTALLYMLYKMTSSNTVELTICDFKKSNEFSGISSKFAEFEDCYDLICSFYDEFLATPEGGNGKIQILIIDEIAGLLTHFSSTKQGKEKADKIRQIMSSILMLGRSRKCFLILSCQRFSATIMPSGSGAADNFHVCIGLGRLTVESRKSLFAGEHFDEEEALIYGQGRGIILIDGEPIKALAVPKVSKKKLLSLLQERNEGARSAL